VGGGAARPRARLAELVAALSLGIDLGFGQPMEHVLRQCLIALRVAGHAGLGEPDRVAVYYTALLINVGCHADAHEQAKWFGDDIAAVIAGEPALAVELSAEQLDRALAAIANFVDLKSPFTLGHSVAVAELAEEAGRRLGLPPEQLVKLRRAGFVYGFGRLGVSNSIWDRPGPLSAGEWERVRMYPYLTERMLHQSAALAPLGEIAVQHRERLDGSGYPRGLSGGAISRPARVLGAADAYQSMREPRPHRPARPAGEAAAELQAEVRAGRLDGPAVDAVLEAAGHRLSRRRGALSGLTAREVEVLVLLARGLSNRQIAERLVITPKTAGNHIEHIYAKIDASSRAAAALFAVQHGLLPEERAGLAAPGFATETGAHSA
jgi:DNA-binding CsgD family transcriptional regulator